MGGNYVTQLTLLNMQYIVAFESFLVHTFINLITVVLFQNLGKIMDLNTDCLNLFSTLTYTLLIILINYVLQKIPYNLTIIDDLRTF